MVRKKSEIGKEPVRLRTKALKNGNKSLYLDVYLDGMRRYEFLKLYLKPDKKEYRIENSNTLKLANAIKAKRIIELQNKKYDFFDQDTVNADLIPYMIQRAKNARGEGQIGQRGIVGTAHRSAELLRQYANRETIPFKMVNKAFAAGYVQFLKNAKSKYGNPLRKNTQHTLFRAFVTALNSAVRDGIINTNPTAQLSPTEKPCKENVIKTYLTVDELRKLYDTDYPASPYTKQIFLFGCMCGLRFSDIQLLRWGNLDFQDNGSVTMTIKQKKTKLEISVPLSKEAIKLLPLRTNQEPNDFVFRGEETIGLCCVSYHLRKWVKMAGITKHVSFHTSRHTYATMLLTLGADLYTVSKLLGHTNIQTTQIYAEVINQKKQEAVDLIPSFQANK